MPKPTKIRYKGQIYVLATNLIDEPHLADLDETEANNKEKAAKYNGCAQCRGAGYKCKCIGPCQTCQDHNAGLHV